MASFMQPWDLQNITEKLHRDRTLRGSFSAPALVRSLTRDTAVTVVYSEAATSEEEAPPPLAEDDSEASNISAARLREERPLPTTTITNEAVEASELPPLCRSQRRRDICLVKHDPWTRSVVTLVADGPRLTLRAADLFPREHHSAFVPAIQASFSSANHDLSSGATTVVDVDRDDSQESDENGNFLPFRHVYSTQWSLGDSACNDLLLMASDDQGSSPSASLIQVDCPGLRTGCSPDIALALSPQQIFRVDLSTAGSAPQLGLVQSLAFDQPMSVNATVMEPYGQHCTLVGFSNGQIHVYDWRASPMSTGPCLTLAAVPQPLWLLPRGTAAAQRRRLGLSTPPSHSDRYTSAGILSCCTLEESWRVVCGLADAKGAVVVADLRKGLSKPTSTVSTDPTETSSTGAITAMQQAFAAAAEPSVLHHALNRKRTRRSPLELATKRLLDGRTTLVTGRTIAAMQHCQEHFGIIGMVDVDGTPILTSIRALEGGRCNSGFHNTEVTSCDNQRNSRDEQQVATRRGMTGPRTLPSPSEVLARLRHSTSSVPQAGPPLHASVGPSTTTSSLGNRCTFANNGGTFVYTHMDGAGITTASFLASGHGDRMIAPDERQAIMVRSSSHPDSRGAFRASQRPSIAAVSALGNVVCLETTEGHSMCITIHQ